MVSDFCRCEHACKYRLGISGLIHHSLTLSADASARKPHVKWYNYLWKFRLDLSRFFDFAIEARCCVEVNQRDNPEWIRMEIPLYEDTDELIRCGYIIWLFPLLIERQCVGGAKTMLNWQEGPGSALIDFLSPYSGNGIIYVRERIMIVTNRRIQLGYQGIDDSIQETNLVQYRQEESVRAEGKVKQFTDIY